MVVAIDFKLSISKQTSVEIEKHTGARDAYASQTPLWSRLGARSGYGGGRALLSSWLNSGSGGGGGGHGRTRI